MQDNLKTSLSNVFAGRGSELDQLRSYLKLAAQGCGNFVVIGGEVGIGKMTLVQNFTAEADEQGATVVTINLSQFLHTSLISPFCILSDICVNQRRKKSLS